MMEKMRAGTGALAAALTVLRSRRGCAEGEGSRWEWHARHCRDARCRAGRHAMEHRGGEGRHDAPRVQHGSGRPGLSRGRPGARRSSVRGAPSTVPGCGASRSPTRTRTGRATSPIRSAAARAPRPPRSRSATTTTTTAGTGSTSPAAPTTRRRRCTTRSTREPWLSPTAPRPWCSSPSSPRASSRTTSARRACRRRPSPASLLTSPAAATSTRWSSARTTTRARPTRSASTARPRTRRAPSGSTPASTSTTWTGWTSRSPMPRSMPATTAGPRRFGRSISLSRPACDRRFTDGRPTDHFGNAAATDPKVRVLQARDASGNAIFTMMNLADHNQDIGQSDDYDVAHALSSDWPGYFHRRLEQDVGGMSMFLAADIGSMEDLITDPAIPGPPCFSGANGCYAQVELTGNTIADHVAAELANAEPVPIGAVGGQRTEFCVPLENNLFRAAFEAGLFGERQGYTNCQPTGRVGNEVHTSVAVLDVGADLQFIVNPGEAFPGLMLGSPWGIEDASCPARENPPVPTWHASAKHRFQVGLGDDLIGYEKPAWSFVYEPPTFTAPDCNTDPHGPQPQPRGRGGRPGRVEHGRRAAHRPARPEPRPDRRDPPRPLREGGRYVDGRVLGASGPGRARPLPDGCGRDLACRPRAPRHSIRRPAIPTAARSWRWTGSPRSATDPWTPTATSWTSTAPSEPSGPDITTRGMLVKSGDGGVSNRYYVDVYPALTVSGSLGPASALLPASAERALDRPVSGPGLQAMRNPRKPVEQRPRTSASVRGRAESRPLVQPAQAGRHQRTGGQPVGRLRAACGGDRRRVDHREYQRRPDARRRAVRPVSGIGCRRPPGGGPTTHHRQLELLTLTLHWPLHKPRRRPATSISRSRSTVRRGDPEPEAPARQARPRTRRSGRTRSAWAGSRSSRPSGFACSTARTPSSSSRATSRPRSSSSRGPKPPRAGERAGVALPCFDSPRPRRF